LTAPDPEKAFVARLRAALPNATVGTALTSARPMVVVSLLTGTTQVRHFIDRVRLDLVCYGNDTLPARTLAAQVRDAIWHGFTAGGGHTFLVVADPPYPLPDVLTNEMRVYVPTTASCYPLA
jgi:hypothetical protein